MTRVEGRVKNKEDEAQNKKGWIVVFSSPRHPTLHPQRLTPESATGLRTDPSQPEADPSFGGLRRNLSLFTRFSSPYSRDSPFVTLF